jgi:ABC-type nitrate/sulfonate/bicarbonate transport system substrate-binding protein
MTTKMRLIVFPGVQNLPNFAAEEQGFFAKRGFSIETTFTSSSEQQREGLAQGLYDIAHAAIDNAVAMVDVAGEDIAIVIGLDQAFNKLVVRPEIATYEDLRGKTLGVDAPDTAFALVVYDMLARKGMQPGDYKVLPIGATRFRLEAMIDGKVDFAMLNLPFNLMAQRAGLALLDDPAKVIGAYQSTGGFVQRAWAQANRATLAAYLAAYIEGLRWVLDPANAVAAIALLAQRMDLSPEMAAECFAQMSDPALGFTPDAAIDHGGMAKVLALRAAFKGNAEPAPADRYIDESFYREALALL